MTSHRRTYLPLRRVLGPIILLVVSAVFVGGCGMPDQVDLVDTNTPETLLGDSGEQPAARYGADTLLRSVALARARGRALQARDLIKASQTGAASDVVNELVSAEWPLIREYALERAPEAAASLEKLFAQKTWTVDDLVAIRSQLERVDEQISPPSARSDPGYRAAVLALVLDDASAFYSTAAVTDGDSTSGTDPLGWSAARGMLLVAQEDLVPTLPEVMRDRVAKELRTALDSAFTSVLPPASPVAIERVENMISDVSSIILDSGIDTAAPTVTKADLDAADEAIKGLELVKAAAAKSSAEGLKQLSTFRADEVRRVLAPVSNLDQEAFLDVDRLTGSELRAAIQSGNDVDEAFVSAKDALQRAREAIASEYELMLQDE